MPLMWEAENFRLMQQAVDKEAQKGEACTSSWFTDYYGNSFAYQDDVWLEAKGSWLHYALEGLHCSLMS